MRSAGLAYQRYPDLAGMTHTTLEPGILPGARRRRPAPAELRLLTPSLTSANPVLATRVATVPELQL